MKFLLICTVIFVASKTKAFNSNGGLKMLTDNFLKESVAKAKHIVDNAYADTRYKLKTRKKREALSMAQMMSYNKQPTGKSRECIRVADYMDATNEIMTRKLKETYASPFNISDVLTAEQKEILNQLTGCAFQYLPKVCSNSPYRTINGECNNRKKPMHGAANTAFLRLLPPEYEDGISLPKGWTENRTWNGFRLPLAREVSNYIVSYGNNTPTMDTQRSVMFMQWGQYLDHDCTLAPDSPATSGFFDGVDCDTSCAMASPCFPLMIPENDTRIKNRSECISLYRSAPVCNLVSPVRQQINVVTSYIDASQVYGSDQAVANKLRNNTNNMGLLAVNKEYTDKGRQHLPFDESNGDICKMTNTSAGIPCFFAGDVRVSEMAGLTAFHTLHLREHNRIAKELHKLNSHWSGDKIYEETRKIIAAIIQKITYYDWIPKVLGDETSKVLPAYTGYDENVNPTISNVFTVAFRFGHSIVDPTLKRSGSGYEPYPDVPLHLTFFSTWRMIFEGGIEPIIQGMMANFAKLNTQEKIMDDEMRERLFFQFRKIALDLAAVNIQRGRERGLPGYNTWRRHCGLPAPKNEAELAIVLNNKKMAQKFIKLYGNPENMDFWVAAISEPLVKGGRIGPLLTCIIGDQFRRLRDGDWFYFEHEPHFSPAQRNAIMRMTLSSIICDNTNITVVPMDVFMGNPYSSNYVPCSTIPSLDVSLWKESCEKEKEHFEEKEH